MNEPYQDGQIIPNEFIWHHDISFSDKLVTEDGTIDCKFEDINSLTFTNQGTSVVTINGAVKLQPGQAKSYQTQDESCITNSFDWSFGTSIGAGVNQLVITRGKRMASYASKAVYRKVR